VLHAIANDTGILETVNIVNKGTVPNLPDEAVVEVCARINSKGAHPVEERRLPFSVEGMVRDAYAFARLTVDAALSGDRKLVLQAAMAHPAHRDLDIIEKVIAELFEAHREFLPQFK
jgi:6-phospho-beta-glucosidase